MQAPHRMQHERLAEGVARAERAAAVVDQHEVQLTAGNGTVKMRRVGGHRLTGGVACQQA